MKYGKGKEKNTIRKRRSREKWDGKNYVHKQEQMNCGNGKEKKTILHNRRSRDKEDGKNCERIGTDELWELKRKIQYRIDVLVKNRD